MESLIMTPPTGERLLRFVGDRLPFSLRLADGSPLPNGWRALLRTNLGRGAALRREIIQSYPGKPPLANSAWHDIPLQRAPDGSWGRELALVEPGFYRAKAYAVDSAGRQLWAAGPDVGIAIHPNAYRSANTIYCAFVRLFGPGKTARQSLPTPLSPEIERLDTADYVVIPPSGKLRDLVRELPHIFDKLGCRILHLLPVNPVPTTYARMGRFGSPYAAQDLTAIDPALIEFDQRTTGVDQFCELTRAVHRHGGRVFLDIVINHTGWGSTLQETRPDWFLREANGEFVSPGAWGVTWADLVELDHRNPALWAYLGDVFLTWCRRGVDGFRCDAGYKVPLRAWRYIIARVTEEFPETIFLLEGLGGPWETTEALLTEGGMQWAYSELFQNYSGAEVARYLDYAMQRSERLGLYVHYSETHDNPRLAQRGRTWACLRNHLCALTSPNGAFGFTCGVEWLATEKIDVHESRALAWDNPDNLIPELRRLNQLLVQHPCFFDGVQCIRESPLESPVVAVRRHAPDGGPVVLVLINTDAETPHGYTMKVGLLRSLGDPIHDLITGTAFVPATSGADTIQVTLPAGGALCLGSPLPHLEGLGDELFLGEAYRESRARAAWGVNALSAVMPAEGIGVYRWGELADVVDADPAAFLAAVLSLPDRRRETDGSPVDLVPILQRAAQSGQFLPVTRWSPEDCSRVLPIPASHWLLVLDNTSFRACLHLPDETRRRAASVKTRHGHAAFFAPGLPAGTHRLELERDRDPESQLTATISVYSLTTQVPPWAGFVAYANTQLRTSTTPASSIQQLAGRFRPDDLVLLTNGRGGMARLCLDLGRVTSKYDAWLAANLDPEVPVDRHVFVKRVRFWLIADGFISPLNIENLLSFEPGPPAHWQFVASAGDGRAAEIHISVQMQPHENTTLVRLHRPPRAPALGADLPDLSAVSLTVRVDIEDRNFHQETHRNPEAEAHFCPNTHPLSDRPGFAFRPAGDRQLRVYTDRGRYHHGDNEWSEHIPHPLEATRGLVAAGDAFSPGWFELPFGKGETINLVLTAESRCKPFTGMALEHPKASRIPPFTERLLAAMNAFVVKRANGRTVIAGYPWFLDWGRDTLIAARGLLAAGQRETVLQLLQLLGRWEVAGTLPNAIFGENASNRDTSDAPLWFGKVCSEFAQALERADQRAFYTSALAPDGRTVLDVLQSIAQHFRAGTSNHIRMDPDSALIWSPPHFTWMDTNFPAATPREGYPIEIQALWIALLDQLATLNAPTQGERWSQLATRARLSFDRYFWLEESGWFADVLLAPAGQPARTAVPDTALRSNYLLPISFGLISGERARRGVTAALRHLVVPGAIRSLAPLPVSPPLPIYSADGRLLNNPLEPYCGRYEGDEDTQRKPAYHNGTAWTWMLPVFCEALARAWDFDPIAVESAKAHLRTLEPLMEHGCLGHLPEVLDGDAPHQSRGCDAQSWSVTEAYRVWRLLE